MVVDADKVEGAALSRLDPQTLVDDAMRRWPATVAVFIRWRMKCIGCPFGGFHSIAHACDEHEMPLAPFLAALEQAIAA